MPKIPEFQQRQLASSRVGTQGASTSTTNLFKVLAGESQGISNQLAAQARDTQIQIAAAKREQAAVAKAQQALLDKSDEAVYGAQNKMAIDEVYNRVKADSLNAPESAPTIFSSTALEAVDKGLENIPERLRPQVRINAVKAIQGRASELSNWVPTQRTQNSQAQFESTTKELVLKAGDLATFGDLENTWQAIDGMGASAISGYGAEAGAKLAEAKKSAAEQFITGRMVADHNSVRPLIDSGVFDGVLTATEQRKLLDDANRLEAADFREQEHQGKLDAMSRRIEYTTNEVNIETATPVEMQSELQTARAALNAELALPTPNESNINKLSQRIEELTTGVDEYGTDKAKDKAEKARIFHNSDEAVTARAKLRTFKEGLSGQTFSTKQEALSALNDYEAIVEKGRQNGVLNGEEYESSIGWVAKQRTKVQNAESKNGGLFSRLGQLFNSPEDEVTKKAHKVMKTVPPKKGETSARAMDRRTKQYDAEMSSLISRFKTSKGRDPNPGDLQILSAAANRAVAAGG